MLGHKSQNKSAFVSKSDTSQLALNKAPPII